MGTAMPQGPGLAPTKTPTKAPNRWLPCRRSVPSPFSCPYWTRAVLMEVRFGPNSELKDGDRNEHQGPPRLTGSGDSRAAGSTRLLGTRYLSPKLAERYVRQGERLELRACGVVFSVAGGLGSVPTDAPLLASQEPPNVVEVEEPDQAGHANSVDVVDRCQRRDGSDGDHGDATHQARGERSER